MGQDVKKGLPYFFAAALIALVAVAMAGVDHLDQLRREAALRAQVYAQTNALQARLEKVLNAPLLLTGGIASEIEAHGDITPEIFAAMANVLIRDQADVRNITLSRGTKIAMVFPADGNESVVGVDYRTIATQWPVVANAIATRSRVMQGPIALLQGGIGLIVRQPIYTTAPDGTPSFYGIVSVLLDIPGLFRDAGLERADLPVAVALRGADGGLIHGQAAVFEQAPLILDIPLPAGIWQLGAIPREGWDEARAATLVQTRSLEAILMGLLMFGAFAVARQIDLRTAVTAALRVNEEKLRGLFELSPLGIALNDLSTGDFVEFNEAFRKITGYAADTLKRLDYWTLTPHKYDGDVARQIDLLNTTGRYGPYEKEYLREDGALVPVQLNGMVVTGSDGRPYIWSIVEDISARKQAEMQTRIAATAFESQDGLAITDTNAIVLRVNKAFTEMTGYSAEESVGQPTSMFRSGRHEEAFYTRMWEDAATLGVWRGELWARRKNGELYPQWLTITAVRAEDGTTSHFVANMTDISFRKEAESQINHLAFFDPLTRLPNRRLLMDRLQQALASCGRSGHGCALLFIDLDNFKMLNDTLGHHVGDRLLQEVASRLSACVREGDTVARIGGDEFVVMLEDLSANLPELALQTETVGEKILQALNRPYMLNGKPHHSTPSIGATLFNSPQHSVEELLKRADLAMYQAKDAGRNTLRFFDPDVQAGVNARAQLEAALRQGITEAQFTVYYQPQIDDALGLIGAEALVRWNHPERGLVPPLEFIALAEETGLIIPLGLWVLETVCMQLVAWSANPDTAHLTVAVNVSARQFQEPDFVHQVLAVLERTGVAASTLKLEITEGILFQNMADIVAKMSVLKARGLSFSLDDFGTGYSSLAYLKRLPLGQLKIDQTFVRDILTDANDATIVSTTVALGQSFGLNVIAEGVETDAQRQFLAHQGCHTYQGFLFGRPVPVEEFERTFNLVSYSVNSLSEIRG